MTYAFTVLEELWHLWQAKISEQEANVEQKQVSIHITLTHFSATGMQHEFKIIWRINPLKCLSAYVYVCVCVCVWVWVRSFKGACGWTVLCM